MIKRCESSQPGPVDVGRPGANGRRSAFAVEQVQAGVLDLDRVLVDVAEDAHLGDVQAADLVLDRDAVADELADQPEGQGRRGEHPDDVGHDANDLGQELADAAAVEQADRGGRDAVQPAAVLAVGEQADREAAEGTIDAVDADRADGVVDLEHALDEEDAPDHQHAGDGTDDDRGDRGRVNEGARGGDGDGAGEEAVAGHRGVGLPVDRPHVDHRGEAARGCSQHRADGDGRHAEVGRGHGRAGVEAEPAEGQDQGAEHDHRDVVARDGVGRAVLVELADPRPEQPGGRQGGHAAGHVHHRRAGVVEVPVAQAEVGAEVRQPAAAPDPATVDGVDEGAEQDREEAEADELPALGEGTRGDGRRGVHEHHLEQEEDEDGGVVGVAREEEALVAEEVERLAEEFEGEHLVEDVRAVEGEHGSPAAGHEAEADRPEAQHADAVDDEVHRHRVAGVLVAGQAGLDEREARLHEHDEEPAEQGPRHVQADLDQLDVLGQGLGRDLVAVLGEGGRGADPRAGVAGARGVGLCRRRRRAGIGGGRGRGRRGGFGLRGLLRGRGLGPGRLDRDAAEQRRPHDNRPPPPGCTSSHHRSDPPLSGFRVRGGESPTLRGRSATRSLTNSEHSGLPPSRTPLDRVC